MHHTATCVFFPSHGYLGRVSFPSLPQVEVDSLYYIEQFGLKFPLHPCLSDHFGWIMLWLENILILQQFQQLLSFTLPNKMKPPRPLKVTYLLHFLPAITHAPKGTLIFFSFLFLRQRMIPGYHFKTFLDLYKKNLFSLFLREHDHPLSGSLRSVDKILYYFKA